MRGHNVHRVSPYGDVELGVSYEAFKVIFGLSRTAAKVYLYLRERSPRLEDIIYVDKEDMMSCCGFKTEASVYKALGELVNAEILAGRRKSFEFYYNPLFIGHEKER